VYRHGFHHGLALNGFSFMGHYLNIVETGLLDYLDSWELQKDLAHARRDGSIPDTLLLTEHPPTYTIGRRGSRHNLLIDDETLERVGARCYEVDRGGDITFHGPGQLVAYLIMDLGRAERSLRRFVGNLEASVIDTLATFGISSEPAEGKPGVWVNGRKIAAVGVAVSRRVTYHGFALNVNPDLAYFDYMIPCGIPGSAATSIEQELESSIEMSTAMQLVVNCLTNRFEVESVRRMNLDRLREIAAPSVPASSR
jgi:lipoate-protein ligase B